MIRRVRRAATRHPIYSRLGRNLNLVVLAIALSALPVQAVRRQVAPPEGRMQLWSLDVVVPIHLRATADGTPFELEKAKLGEKVATEFEKARLFFLRNSGFRLNLKIDYVVIDDRTAKVKDGWIEPESVRSDLKELLAKKGRSLESYDSIVALYAEHGFDAPTPEEVGAVGGGGLSAFGYSVFGMSGKLAWLFLHEYHHQVQFFFERSGLARYPVNHPEPGNGPAACGDHWDLNARILRTWPAADWLLADYGKIIETDDRDRDGMPDSDARLALDEVRFGSSRLKPDTDGDGLADLQEAMSGIYSGSDPVKPDTDGDGLADGSDPYPLYALDPVRRKASPTIDGIVMPDEWQEFHPIKSDSLSAKTYMNWSEGHIYFAAICDAPFRMELEIDPDDDGRFVGPLISVVVSALDPKAVRQIAGPKGTFAITKTENGKTALELAVPVTNRSGKPIGENMKVGLRAVLSNGAREWHLFEPWTQISVRLAAMAERREIASLQFLRAFGISGIPVESRTARLVLLPSQSYSAKGRLREPTW